MRLWCFILVLLVLCPFTLVGQRSHQATRLDHPIVIDGVHEPGIWIGADSATGFFQMEPLPGDPASEHTACYVGFDQEKIYISVNLYQEKEVLAKVMSRDVLSKGDDCFVITFDPYNDNRSGYGFWTNALGTQTDFRINDDGRNTDVNWDAEWESASSIHDRGWTLEMAIPFKSLQFKPGSDTWGVNFGRVIRSNFETVWWSGTVTDDFRISQGGKLTGIKTPDSKGKLTLVSLCHHQL